jgi:hypothetical protein
MCVSVGREYGAWKLLTQQRILYIHDVSLSFTPYGIQSRPHTYIGSKAWMKEKAGWGGHSLLQFWFAPFSSWIFFPLFGWTVFPYLYFGLLISAQAAAYDSSTLATSKRSPGTYANSTCYGPSGLDKKGGYAWTCWQTWNQPHRFQSVPVLYHKP